MRDLPMIYKLAWSFHNTTGLPIDDFVGEGSLAYVECRDKYRPSMGVKFSTYAHRAVQNRMIDHAQQNLKHLHEQLEPNVEEPNRHKHNYDPPNLDHRPGQEERTAFKAALEGGSEELKYMCWVIFQSPAEYLNVRNKRGLVQQRLRAEGWTWDMIWRAFSEMKELLSKTAI